MGPGSALRFATLVRDDSAGCLASEYPTPALMEFL